MRKYSHWPAKLLTRASALGSGEHALNFCGQYGPVPQPALLRDAQQVIVRNAAPEEERQPRGELDIADAMDRTCGDTGGIPFSAEHELRARQYGAQRRLDALLEVTFTARGSVEGKQAFDIDRRGLPAIRAARQGCDNPPGAGVFLIA